MKETFSHYGWMVAIVVTVFIVITFTTPIGNHIVDGVKDVIAWLANESPGYEAQDETPPPLATPENLRVEGDYLLFSEVPGARRYAIAINGETVAAHVPEPKFNISKWLKAAGTEAIDIQVMAIDHFNEHSNSAVAQLRYYNAGLFDKDNNLLASWESLVNNYGLEIIERSSPGNRYETSIGGIIDNNHEFKNAVRLVIPGDVDTIPQYFLYGTNFLKEIILCNGVSKIEHSSFCYSYHPDTALKRIVIPPSVTEINGGAITVGYCCSSLTTITFEGTISQWNAINKASSWLSGKTNDVTITVVCSDGVVVIK